MITLLRNGKIFTANKKQLWVNAIAYKDDKIIYVGEDDPGQWRPFTESRTTIIDLEGKCILPGIIDSHVHPAAVAMSSWHVKVPMFEEVKDFLKHIKAYADKHSKEEVPFLYFEYYPTSMFGPNGPTKELLDKAVSDRPCLCQDFGEHMHWVNSKMLELMEVDAQTKDPVPGLEMFVRDKSGNPTGWVKEMAWMAFADTMYKKIGWWPPKDVEREDLKGVLDVLSLNGITALFDAVIESEKQLEVLKSLDQKNQLHMYYDAALRFRSYKELSEKILKMKEYSKKYKTKHIKLQTMKLFLDGTNEAGNGALLEAHVCDPEGKNYGEIKMEEEELKKCLLLCNENEMNLHLHMVGDRAFRVGCNAVEAAKTEAGKKGMTWTSNVVFAHCELVDPEDIKRPAALGIFVNWSCHWSGGYFGDEAMRFISREKWDTMYQFNPMIQAGVQVAFSSDVVTGYELERANPFFGMQVANTRVDPEFPLDHTKYPESIRPTAEACISMEELIRGYTYQGALQIGWQSIMGSLQCGKLANLCVVCQNPLEINADRIKEIQVEAVIFEGEVIHGKI